MPLEPRGFARTVDHTLLDAAATADAIDRLCDEAAEHEFAAVCVYPWWVERAARRLDGAGPAVCTVVGFPHGLDPTGAKVEAARRALAAGAREIDMVLAYGALRSGDGDGPRADAAAVVEAVHADGGLAKVIVESAKLSDDGLREACAIVAASGADFGKTSTGFAGGATVAAVEAMRAHLPDRVAIKASAGIRDAEAAEAMLAAGASRIGTSSALAILAELRARVVA